MGNKEKTLSCLKIAIIILAGLIVLSITGIAARYIYLSFYRPEQSTVTIPYNLIGKEDKTEKEDKKEEETVKEENKSNKRGRKKKTTK